ncbi:MAG TPA: PAS domain-containing protein, partial [Verrucomicrobiae bacterium]|nr:PAS domain-containing protein [Verrucomicrobiae bacterium]
AYSAEWKRQLGYADDEISNGLGEWEGRVHPDDLPKLKQRIAEYLGSPWPDFEEHFRICRKDGSWRHMLARVALVRDEQGQPARLVGCQIDITSQKLIENELTESQRKLEEAQRIAHVGHWERDLKTDLVAWSDEIYRIFGLAPRPQKIHFPEFLELVDPGDRARVARSVSEAVRDLQHYSVEYRIVRANGEERFVRSEGDVIRDDSGRPLRAFGILQDITDRKRMENVLRESESQLRLVIDTIPTMAWILRPDGTVEFLNQRWLDYSGISLEEALQNPLRTLHPDDVPRALKKWSADMAAGVQSEDEMRLRRADGEYRWFLVRTVPMHDERGNIIKWYGTSADIEDRKRAEEALRETQAALARVSRVTTVGELTASIAHEVNQPLGAVVINAEAALHWLADKPPNLSEVREALQGIIRDGNRAGEVVARIRALLKNGTPTKTQFSLGDMIGEIVALTHAEAERRQVSVQTRLEPNLPPLTGDRVQLQQVLMNLVINSLDALSEVAGQPRALTILAGMDSPRSICISVQDTGIGIDPQRMTEVFEPFHTTKTNGLGLGLSISRSIVEAHGGALSVLSNEGPGVTFQFTLPVNGADAP